MVKSSRIVAVVDDDESVCRSIKRLLLSAGIGAETFVSGEAFLNALSAVPSFSPDCVILDLQMPGINGLEVQRQLAPRDLPVIIITAHDDITVRERAMASGATAYLRKPFNGSALIKAVEQALGINPSNSGDC
ncbi:response regulator [Paraburkholderia sp. RL17-383-BIF-A]|jgi:FixJ family two-component response regulator|uniref:response regulator transcription factor n=1 Tax=Burkholderiaceae TaxID=119060 RepID=UPI000894CCAC|nr:response regulator [Burkholderia sp. WP9]SEC75180.1 Response regulator receiver domain-containing protein [Burkholderia sp. WP9]